MKTLKTIILTTLLLLGATATNATSYTVSTTDDELDASPSCETGSSTDCSLREAIVEANANAGSDTIIIPAGTFFLTVGSSGEDLAAQGDLDITDTSGVLTIEGAGEGITIIDGSENDRIFDVREDAAISLSDMTLQNGAIDDVGGALYADGDNTITIDSVTVKNNTVSGSSSGGGVYISSSEVVISNSTFSGNTSDYEGGGLYYRNITGTYTVDRSIQISNTTFTGNSATDEASAGGLYINFNDNADADSSISNVTITSNQATNTGGGAYILGDDEYATTISDITVTNNTTTGDDGGGLAVSGDFITIDGAYIAGNSAGVEADGNGDGGGLHAFASSTGSITVKNSVIVNNTAYRNGGGVLMTSAGSASGIILNTTVANNAAAEDGGGVYLGGSSNTYTILSSLVTGNTADSDNLGSDEGGGFYTTGTSTFTILNSIVSDNLEYQTANNCDDTWTSGGYNIEDRNDCGFGESTDLPSTEPDLVEAGLEDNGGDFQTIGLQSGSPAIDVIPSELCLDASNDPLTQDQRGFTRPHGAKCDIGPYEFDTVAPTLSVSGSSATVECKATYTDAGATATDNFGTPTVATTNPVDTDVVGSYTVSYTATDYDGNIDTETRSVTVSDTADPIVILTGEASVTLTVGDTYTESGATATDTCDGTLTATPSGTVDTTTAGEYTVTYTATDDSDNSATVTRTVTVEEDTSGGGDDPEDVTVTGVTPLTNSRVRITYSDDSTRTITAFSSGSQKPRVKLTSDGARVVVLKRNGRNVRVFDALTGERLRGKKLRTKSQDRAYMKLVEKSGKEYVVVATKRGNTIRTTLMRLTASSDKLLNTNTKRLTYRKSNFRVQIRNSRIRIKKLNGTVKRVYKITNNHNLKKVR